MKLLSKNLTNKKLTLIQVMAWRHQDKSQAISHHLNQYWPRSVSPYGITRPQWVEVYLIKYAQFFCALFWFGDCFTILGGCKSFAYSSFSTRASVAAVLSRYLCVSSCLWVNTLRPRQNGRHFADDTFKRIFFNENVRISINFHWNLFLRFQSTIFHHWFR